MDHLPNCSSEGEIDPIGGTSSVKWATEGSNQSIVENSSDHHASSREMLKKMAGRTKKGFCEVLSEYPACSSIQCSGNHSTASFA